MHSIDQTCISFAQSVFKALSRLMMLKTSVEVDLTAAKNIYKDSKIEAESNELFRLLAKLKNAKTESEFLEIRNSACNSPIIQAFSYGPSFLGPGKIAYNLRTNQYGFPNALARNVIKAIERFEFLYTSILVMGVIEVENFLVMLVNCQLFDSGVQNEVEEYSPEVLDWVSKMEPDACRGFGETFASFRAARNCFVHSEGRVNERNAKWLQPLKVGERIPMQKKRLTTCFDEYEDLIFRFLKCALEKAGYSFFPAVLADCIDLYYETTPAESRHVFDTLMSWDVPMRGSLFLVTAMDLYCQMKTEGDIKPKDIENALAPYSDCKGYDLCKLLLLGERDSALKLLGDSTDESNLPEDLRMPLLDGIII